MRFVGMELFDMSSLGYSYPVSQDNGQDDTEE